VTKTSEPESSADLADLFDDDALVSRLQKASPTGLAAVAGTWRCAQAAPALTTRMKELVLVALHATATTMHVEGIRRHVARALAAGATQVDVLDVLLTISGIATHALYSAVPILMRELEAMSHPDAELPPISPETQAIKDEFVRARGFWNPQRDVIVRAMPEYFAALNRVSTEPWNNGSLSAKERELVCIAIDCTVTHMYEPGLTIHIRHALQQGASRQEIVEVFQLAAVLGVNGFVEGARALFSADDVANG